MIDEKVFWSFHINHRGY